MTRFVYVFFCSLALLHGQTSTSQIGGAVRDASGAVVPGASVTTTNEETGLVYRQTTTAAGLYAFPSVPAGTYTVTVEAKGFRTVRATGNVLTVGTPVTVDVTLEVGASTESVSVEGSYEKLQSDSAAIGNVVTAKEVQELPLNGRNPLGLLVLEPGVVQRSAGGVGSGIHVNGSRDRAYNVTIDGIEANESTVPNPMSNLYRVTPDNIQEYKVTTSNATPEEGRNSGASISIATRRGTNQFHGTAYDFVRNTVLNANEFYANAQGTPKPDIKMNQFGAQLGGPIIKNKSFFFASWADQRTNTTQPIDQTFGVVNMYTPTAAAGVFRYFVADPKNPFALNGQTITRNNIALVDSHTGALAPGVRTCGSPTDLNCVASFNFAANDPARIGVDPTIAKFFGAYPKPNSYAVGDGLNTATYQWNPPALFRGPNFVARVDHQLNDNTSLFFRALWGHYSTLKGDPLNGRPQIFPDFPPEGEVIRQTRNFAAGFRRVISPSVVNEFTVGLSRFIFLFTQGEANPAWPNVPGYAFANVTSPYINTPRTFRAVTTPQILDNLSLTKGSHLIRAGFNFRFYQHNDQRGQPGGVNVTPTVSFSTTFRQPAGFNTPGVATSAAAGINATDNTRLLGTINDVMGLPSRLAQTFLGDLNSNSFLPFMAGNSVTLWNEGQRLKQYNFYVQDQWRARHNLVLTYGLRWEANPAATEAGGRVWVANKAVDGSQGPVTFVKAKRWFENNNLDALAPRIGVAWSVGKDGRTVIRSGYGIAFDTISSFQVTAAAGKVPGLTYTCNDVVGSAPGAGCSPVPDIRISQGFPTAVAPPTVQPSAQLTPQAQFLNSSPALISIDPHLQVPTVHQWDLSIQRELPKGVVAEVAYIGRRGTRLFRSYDLNQVSADPILPSFLLMQQNVNKGCRADGSNCPAGATGAIIPIVASGAVPASFLTSSTTSTDLVNNAAGNFAGRLESQTLALKLRPNQQFGTITYQDSGGDSYYHALQVVARKRFEHGLLFGFAYTWAKSMDDQSVDPVGSSSGGGLSSTTSRAPADIRNWRNERAISDFNRTHVATVSGVYELPFGKGKLVGGNAGSVVNHILGGWTLNGILTAMTGERFTVRSGALTSNFSHQSRAALVGPLPSTDLQPGVPGGLPGPTLFKDASAFALPAPGTNGIGRNMFVGPNYWNVDLGLGKRFSISERTSLQFRAEAFNAFNHPNFDNPQNASTGSPSILSTLFGSACCATVAPPSTQTIIQTGESGRVVQLALKLQF
jgi:hypothetical protein